MAFFLAIAFCCALLCYRALYAAAAVLSLPLPLPSHNDHLLRTLLRLNGRSMNVGCLLDCLRLLAACNCLLDCPRLAIACLIAIACLLDCGKLGLPGARELPGPGIRHARMNA